MNLMAQRADFCSHYIMTIKEACVYFRIGENKLRQIVSEHLNADFVLRVGNRCLIKRDLFAKFLDATNAL